MGLFIILVVISIAGIGAALWLMRSTDSSGDLSHPAEEEKFLKETGFKKSDTDKPSPQSQENKPRLNFLKKLKLGRKNSFDEEIPEATPIEDLKEIFNRPAENEPEDLLKGAELIEDSDAEKVNDAQTETPNEPLSLNPDPIAKNPALSGEEEQKIAKEVETHVQLDELKEKHARLEKLLQEKSQELDKVTHHLESEQRNRKDFNKVKDILEKELKEVKDRARQSQVELNTAAQEIESHKKRLNQQEEKIKDVEKELLSCEVEIDAKNNEIQELKKKLETDAKKTEDKPQSQNVTPDSAKDPDDQKNIAVPDQTEINQKKEKPQEETPAKPSEDSKPEIKTENPPDAIKPSEKIITEKQPKTPEKRNSTGEAISKPKTITEDKKESMDASVAKNNTEAQSKTEIQPAQESKKDTVPVKPAETKQETTNTENKVKAPVIEPHKEPTNENPASSNTHKEEEEPLKTAKISANEEDKTYPSAASGTTAPDPAPKSSQESKIDSPPNRDNILEIVGEDDEVNLEVISPAAPDKTLDTFVPENPETPSEDDLLIDDMDDEETEFLTLQPDILNDESDLLNIDDDAPDIDLTKNPDDKNNPNQKQ